ncbi:dTDP-4-dehydrorhamnose 3,5-epimerase [Candidatus Burkholderia pumila]|uniref:dTDP-4-dehydrorhamnose 3,5-epimerase n=1 Tax=Candidatus Burkholderia pumila TaxID=1090375 RepID=A0ABR5HM31_9BURK|nr:dTDP-4-dehydrorhamnose 3,5-epimerase [Candidatus Burkholderia pumila]
MSLKVIATEIPDVLIIEPKVFGDARGFFFESFNQHSFDEAVGSHVEFVQDNHSLSAKSVLRGLHFQLDPKAQGKLVRVVSGEVFDVAVDVRKESPTYGKWVSAHLSAESKRQFWIPRGFAHGFLVLSEQAEFLYKTDNYFSPENERSIRWDDPTIEIDWPITGQPTLSQKDADAPSLANLSR